MQGVIIIDCLTDWPTIVPMGRQISAKHRYICCINRAAKPHNNLKNCMVGQRPAVYSQALSSFYKVVEIPTLYIHPALPPEQWEDRVCREINEKADLCSMVWQVPR